MSFLLRETASCSKVTFDCAIAASAGPKRTVAATAALLLCGVGEETTSEFDSRIAFSWSIFPALIAFSASLTISFPDFAASFVSTLSALVGSPAWHHAVPTVASRTKTSTAIGSAWMELVMLFRMRSLMDSPRQKFACNYTPKFRCRGDHVCDERMPDVLLKPALGLSGTRRLLSRTYRAFPSSLQPAPRRNLDKLIAQN